MTKQILKISKLKFFCDNIFYKEKFFRCAYQFANVNFLKLIINIFLCYRKILMTKLKKNYNHKLINTTNYFLYFQYVFFSLKKLVKLKKKKII